jgi:Rrf2 family protein
MEITLSRKGDYAVRAVLALSVHAGLGLRKAREIADDMAIPPNFLKIILAELAQAGVVTSTAGRNGGYALARAPRSISLLDIVEIADGPIELRNCVLRGNPCSSAGICAVHNTWSRGQNLLTQHLRRTTFAQLATEHVALQAMPPRRRAR